MTSTRKPLKVGETPLLSDMICLTSSVQSPADKALGSGTSNADSGMVS